MTDAPHRFVLGLGANLGDPAATLIDAVARLAAADGVRVTRVSAPYRTVPVGGVEQDDFLNAVVIGETTLAPLALLRLCQAIEAAHRRTRTVRWGPRTLDLDVLAYDDLESADPDLTLPHPRAHERAFVLVPWLQADADAHLPGRGRVADLLARVGTGGVRRVAVAGWPQADGRTDG